MDIEGFLYSQIGYDLGDPKRAIIRSNRMNFDEENIKFEIIDEMEDNIVLDGKVEYWGNIWKSNWWVVDFSLLEIEGKYKINIYSGKNVIFESDSFEVGDHLLWDQTITSVALDQLERRAEVAPNAKSGWKDCGANWKEVNSHATTIISLCDLMNTVFGQYITENNLDRLCKQIINGCDYLSLCQDKAYRLGFPEGAIIHEIPNQMFIIPGDTAQSVVAFARASRLLTDRYPEKSDEYIRRAELAYEYLINESDPYGSRGFSHWNHGAPEEFNVPDEWMTRDLLMMMWGGIELWAAGIQKYQDKVVSLARKIMKRQVTKENKEGEFYGHFYTFDSCDFTEKANIHHHVGHDTGGTFPHYLIPFMDIITRWYDHPDVELWKKTVYDFAYGYFLPACSKNPFYILPEGYFKGEGLLTFCGPWHGINTSIGFAASLASKLEDFTGDRRFRNIAVGNIQWIAGLNAGVTSESFKGCKKWSEQIASGVAEPYSLIHGIGRQFAECWTGIRGTITNGFSVNPQFEFEIKPSIEADGPWLYTDEDWIPHSAGWISALCNLRDTKFFADVKM